MKEIRRVLERVAFEAHVDIPDGIIDNSELESIVVEALKATDSTGLGLTQAEANRFATDFVEIVEGPLVLHRLE